MKQMEWQDFEKIRMVVRTIIKIELFPKVKKLLIKSGTILAYMVNVKQMPK